VSPKKRSGTRSAASSTSRPPEPLTLYLDESLDGESLATALEQAGARIIRGSKHFPRGTPDETWLNECGRNGWIVLTRDKRIRYRVLERTALHEAGVKAFVFTGGNVSLKHTVQILVPGRRTRQYWPHRPRRTASIHLSRRRERQAQAHGLIADARRTRRRRAAPALFRTTAASRVADGPRRANNDPTGMVRRHFPVIHAPETSRLGRPVSKADIARHQRATMKSLERLRDRCRRNRRGTSGECLLLTAPSSRTRPSAVLRRAYLSGSKAASAVSGRERAYSR